MRALLYYYYCCCCVFPLFFGSFILVHSLCFSFLPLSKERRKEKNLKKRRKGETEKRKERKAKRIYCATLNALDFKYIRKQLSLKSDFVVAGIPECVG